MLKKAVGFAFACVSIASSVSCGKTSSHFVYASLPGSSQIAVFREDPNSGILTAISGSPFSSGAGPTSIAIDPSGKFLYAANAGQGEDDVSLFTLSGDGVPTEQGSRVSVGTEPRVMVMDASGSFLYVANAGSNTVSVFSIDSSSGTLTSVAQTNSSNGQAPVGMSPSDIKLNPAGTVLYVVSSQSGQLAAFNVSAGVLGALIELSGPGNEPGNSPASGPNAIAIDPSGTHLYTADTLTDTITIFSLDTSGLFTETTGSPFGNGIGSHPLALLIDPTGKFIFVANSKSNNIAVYTITSGTGALTAITSSPFGSEAQPAALALDPNRKYLMVGGQSSAGIESFGVDLSVGSLSTIATYTTGNTPTSIAVIQ